MPDDSTDQTDDPFLRAWTSTRRPPLRPQHVLTARLQHAAALRDLELLDAELETLSARRRNCIRRLERLRPQLWPNRSGHHRRRGPIGTPPLPPPPPDAEPLWGRSLRATAVALLHRHGTCSLPELHGLLHRCGYTVDSPRPVQALGDALAYEVERGRCARVRRGVYRAIARAEDVHPPAALTWEDPDPAEPRVDPIVADDPERWSGGRWPTSGRSAADPEPVTDPDSVDDVVAGEDLDRLVALARRRVADLVETELRRTRRAAGEAAASDAVPGDPTSEETWSVFPHGPSFEAHWRRFAVDSVPRVEKWLAKGERRPWSRSGGEVGDDGLGVVAADEEALELDAVEIDPDGSGRAPERDEVLAVPASPGPQSDHTGQAGTRGTDAPDGPEGPVEDEGVDDRGPGKDDVVVQGPELLQGREGDVDDVVGDGQRGHGQDGTHSGGSSGPRPGTGRGSREGRH